MFARLRGLAYEKYGSLGAFAEAMNMSLPAFSKRLRGIVEWKRDEMGRASNLLGASVEELFY